MAQKKDNDRFLAEIPWIKGSVSDTRLEDTFFYKGIGEKCPLEEKIRRLQLFWMMSETFPFYLPQRYHSMDCLALHKNSKDGNYWANASVFLFNSTAIGHRFLADLEAFLELGNPDLKSVKQLPSLYKTMKQKYLKNNLEECESAAEFLLDPWVLLQLPFEPIIAYQWAVALMAEAFKFETKIHSIAYLVSQTLLTSPINKLFNMQLKMARFAEKQFGVFYTYTKSGKGNNYHSYLQADKKNQLFKEYHKILPIIEFALSLKCRDVIKSLTELARRSWAKCKERDVYQVSKDSKKCSHFPFSGYHLFWNHKENLVDLWPPEKSVANHDDCLNLGKQDITLDQLKKFVEDISKKSNVRLTENYDEMLAYTKKEPQIAESIYLSTLLDDDVGILKGGIIYTVVTLQLVALKAAHLTGMVEKTGELYEADDCRNRIVNVGEHYNIRQASNILSKVQPDQKWSYKNILNSVKDSFDEKLVELPDFKQGAIKIAIHLQERIKRIVLKMIERQYESLKEKNFTHYPECQFVQLVLPCFVASFLDLDKDRSASQETKRKYFNFLHELVKSYERTEFPNQIILAEDATPFAFFVNNGLKDHYFQLRCKYVEKALCQMLSNSKICNYFASKGMSSTFFMDSLGENEECYMKVQHWSNLVFMFNSRVRSVLKNMGIPDDEPALLAHETECFIQPNDLVKITPEQIWLLKTHEWVKCVARNPDRIIEEKQKLLDYGVPSQIIEDAEEISEQNLDGIVLYLSIKYFAEDKVNIYNTLTIQKPGFPLDPLVSALWLLSTKDMWKLKLQLANIFTMRDGNEDPTLIPFDVAVTNLCYKTILKCITSEGNVQMNQPGELTFFPVKHCRWCGQVKVKEFRVCPVCAETPEYPDLNLFCSEKCEKEALGKQHEEEHINFLMEQCGIEK